MAALTVDQIVDEVAVVLGTGARSGDNLRTSITRWVQKACRTIAYAYPWDDMRGEQRVQTVAPYTTGTAMFTLGSTTVTGSGTTWTSGMVGRKIALSQGSPPYRIATFVGTGEITIADAYAETTASGSAYTIFQDEYNLAATTHSIEDASLFDGTWSPPLVSYSQREMDAYDIAGSSTGRPFAYGVATSTTVGTPRVRFIPVPDNVYRISFRYLKSWTDIATSETYTTQGLPVDVEELIIDRVLRWAPRVEGSRRVMTDDEWNAALHKVWAAHSKRRYRFGQRRGFMSGIGPRIIFSATGT